MMESGPIEYNGSVEYGMYSLRQLLTLTLTHTDRYKIIHFEKSAWQLKSKLTCNK